MTKPRVAMCHFCGAHFLYGDLHHESPGTIPEHRYDCLPRNAEIDQRPLWKDLVREQP